MRTQLLAAAALAMTLTCAAATAEGRQARRWGIRNVIFDCGGVLVDLDNAALRRKMTRWVGSLDSPALQRLPSRYQRGQVDLTGFRRALRQISGKPTLSDRAIDRAWGVQIGRVDCRKPRLIEGQRAKGFQTYALSTSAGAVTCALFCRGDLPLKYAGTTGDRPMRALVLTLAAAVLLLPAVLQAQTPSEEPGMTAPPAPAPTAPAKKAAEPGPAAASSAALCRSPAEVEAQAYYDKAMRALIDRKLRQARELFQLVITRYQGSRYFLAAKQRLAEIDATPQAAAEPTGIDSSGRVELIIGNSLLWAGYGMVMPLIFTDDGDKWADTFYWTALGAGTVAGVSATLLSSGRAIPDGWAHLHHFSQLWGSWTAFSIYAIAVGADDADDWSARAVAGTVLGGALAGLTTSLIFKDPMSLPRGEAEFITSAATWGSLLGLTASILAMGEDITFRGGMGAVLGVGTASLAAASIWAPPWSKSRVRYIDLMGFGGWLLGGAILAAAKSDDARVYGGVGLGTLIVGLGVGVLVTRGMPDATPGRSSVSLPALVSYVDGNLDWGVPLPKVQPLVYPDRLRMGAFVDLAAGIF